MKKSLRLITAISFAATGLITVAVLPASGAAKAHKVVCYRLAANKVKSAKFNNHCPKRLDEVQAQAQADGVVEFDGFQQVGRH